VDISHTTLRSRLRAGSLVVRTAAPPAPRAAQAAAAKARAAPVDGFGQKSLMM
jgi:hypothetical protein